MPTRLFSTGATRLLIGVCMAAWFTLATSGSAKAHGPTIEISHAEMKPRLLNLFVGTTVHFSNTVSMPGGHVVVDVGGTLESPPLEKPGDGWHYTFDQEGTYEVFVKQHPMTKARIVVIPEP
jgi:plastocyanin